MLTIAVSLDLKWPYNRHCGVYAGISNYCQQHELELVIDENPIHNTDRRTGISALCSGVISRATRQIVNKAKKAKLPLVNVWYSSPVKDLVPGVFPNFVAAGQIRAEHLLELGIQNFATLGCAGDLGHEAESQAFSALLKELGHRCSQLTVPDDFGDGSPASRNSLLALDAWLESWSLPIGVFASTEILARILIQQCNRRGWHVPKDVAVIAGTNETLLCESPSPSLSSIEFGYEQIGYEAAQLLHEIINAGSAIDASDIPSLHRSIVPIELVTRNSTDFLAVHDESVARALEFIHRNSHLSIGPIEVAKAVHTELRTLQRRFDKQLDRPISEEIRRVRIERAKRELAESQNKLADIARKVGFGSGIRMYDIFRREVGITPSEYRKQRRLRR